jgi:hypothetical protein
MPDPRFVTPSARPASAGDRPDPIDAKVAPAAAPAAPRCTSGGDDAVVCERCGASMFRMHAVWRCPSCGYKTDCCGW